MELKDKLDLLWKYLLLLVLVAGMCYHLCHSRCGKYRCGGKGKEFKGCWRTQQNIDSQYHYQDVQISMEVEGKDTLLKVMINGEELSAEEAKAFMKDKDEFGFKGIVKK